MIKIAYGKGLPNNKIASKFTHYIDLETNIMYRKITENKTTIWELN